MRIHPLDRMAVAAFRLAPARHTVFPDGWGDPDVVEAGLTFPAPATAPVDLEWTGETPLGGAVVRTGQFTSPVAHLLGPVASRVPVERVAPPEGTTRAVVLFPAWNDHGFESRRLLAVELAARGIACVSFDIPFYGARRTVPAPRQAIRTVADFAVMGRGAVSEGMALAGSLPEPEVGMAGYSMGANLAALASALTVSGPATACLAGSHGPGPVYTGGMLSRAVAWDRLGTGGRERLAATFSRISVTGLSPLPHHADAVLVGASADGFVPPSATTVLSRHWSGSRLHWVRAGHGTLWWRHRPLLADAVVESFDRRYRRSA